MAYCYECGSELSWLLPEGELVCREVCTGCQSIHYKSFQILVNCFAVWKGQLLWMKRAQNPAKGLWSIPGGFVEQGETLRQAAARELFEETEVEVDPQDLMLRGVGTIVHISQVYVSFWTNLSSGEYGQSDEALELGFFSKDSMPWGEIAYPETMPSIKQFYRDMASGRFAIGLAEISGEDIDWVDMTPHLP